MADELGVADTVAGPQTRPGITVRAAAAYALSILLGFGILALLFGKRGDLSAAWHQLRAASAGWVLAAIAAEAMSLLLFAVQQHRVLTLSGARVPLGGLVGLTLASNAIASTVPGEPAVSGAFRFRYYQRRGVAGASAGWTVFTSLVAQIMGMSVLLLLGLVAAIVTSAIGIGPGRAGLGRASVGAAVVGLILIAATGVVLARRDLLLAFLGRLAGGLRRVAAGRGERIGTRVEATLSRMREIPLAGWSAAGVVATSTAVWGFDFVCLLCSFAAVHAAVPWDGVLLAYGVAQVVGALPVIPGGIGVVEGSLAVILVAYGTRRVPAVSVVLAYRMISFWLAVAVGWLSFALITRWLWREDRLLHTEGE